MSSHIVLVNCFLQQTTLILASLVRFCAHYNIYGPGSPVFLVTSLMCCEQLTVWLCRVYDIKLWISGTYDVTEYQYLKIIYTWYPVKKKFAPNFKLKSHRITIKNHNYMIFLDFWYICEELHTNWNVCIVVLKTTNEISIIKNGNFQGSMYLISVPSMGVTGKRLNNTLWFSIIKLSNDCHYNSLTLSVCGSESGTLLWGSPIAEVVLFCQN